MAMRNCVVATAALMCLSCGERAVSLPEAPTVRARDGLAAVTLTATRESNGRDAFVFDGHDVPPTIRVAPGDTLKIHYVNALPAVPETAPRNGQMNMTNLHFHGLSVSPMRPQDDVVDMIAMPGEALDYTLVVPRDHLPGLHWYHTHPHGESHRQVLDGMSGALIIEGIEAYAPEVRTLRERVLLIRELDIEHNPNAAALRSRVQVEQTACGESHDQVDRLFTVNGALRPEISMRPGERQFWRIVNAGADRYVDVEVPRQRLAIVAYDGLPVAYHNPGRSLRRVDHVLLPPAGRVEAIVTAPDHGRQSVFRTRCVDTGPDGDPNPGMILADIASIDLAPAGPPATAGVAMAKPPAFSVVDLQRITREPPRFTAVFSEDDKGFYINGQKYSADAQPMVRAKIGGYEHWRIVNNSREIHPMHIHQVHFMPFLQNDRPFPDPHWLDTVNVPVGGSVDVIMDFTDPIIRGMSLFHCHLLNHEDKGMMAKVLFF
jgi:suppressor of ftsI